MKRRNWKVWVTGIVLVQLLVIGADVALWPVPSEAEQAAGRMKVGETLDETDLPFFSRMDAFGNLSGYRAQPAFSDGSSLELMVSFRQDGEILDSVEVLRPNPIHPMTRLRRTLARVFPYLAD
jgi:hypothetical protein